MKKVLTMTMNPCIDRTIYFETFTPGATNYVDNMMEEAAGKGINVAVALKHVGVPVKAIGFSYTDNASMLYDKLGKEQIDYKFVELQGRMRVNQKLFDQSTKEMTECNERGQAVDSAAVDQLLYLLEDELKEASILVLCGSVPPGVAADIYGRMIRMAKEYGVLTVLDATGQLLEEGIKEKPYLIKPNVDEFRTTFFSGKNEKKKEQVKSQGEGNLEQKAMELVGDGITYVCISMGKEGMLLADKSGTHRHPAVETDVKSLQGAGDAMVAGLCKAICEKREDRMAEYALELAASTICMEGTQMGYLLDRKHG